MFEIGRTINIYKLTIKDTFLYNTNVLTTERLPGLRQRPPSENKLSSTLPIMNRPGVVEGCQDIVQISLCMRPLEYHPFVSALRIHDTAVESYLTNKRNQVENSSFVSYGTQLHLTLLPL